MKKAVSSFIFILFIMFAGVSSASAAGFKDVPSTHSFYEEINYLAGKKVISGFEDSTFRPDSKVTRAAAAAMIGRSLDLDGTQTESKFTDVGKSNFASGYIESAVKKGIIKGFTDGTFRPDDIVTRGQMAIFLARAFEVNETSSFHFSDVNPSTSAYNSIKKILSAGITQGYDDHTFRPDMELTRGQFSAFLARALDEKFRVSPPEPVKWEGEWVRHDLSNKGNLEITKVQGNQFEFQLSVTSGANTGEIEGIAKISGNKATFVDSRTSCKLSFTHNKNQIDIEQSSQCNYHGGMGTFFFGSYTNDQQAPTYTLFSSGVVDTQEQDNDIQALVGDDYKRLVESMQLIYKENDEELDAQVTKGFVRGLGTIMEGIVMIDPQGHYYVALISGGEDGRAEVHYYTTNPEYQYTLPNAIWEWQERLGYPVKVLL